MRRIAVTRDVGSDIGACELTHLERSPIDVARARRQHEAYRKLLAELGCEVRALPALPGHPDAVFVEDAAVVVGEAVVLLRPGAESRREEVSHLEAAISELGPFDRVTTPGTVDGGDVLVHGRDVYVGRTSRTNDAGIEQLADILMPRGYTTRAVDVEGCLHLKSAATSFGGGILANPKWVDTGVFAPHRVLTVDPSEPGAANVLVVGEALVVPKRFPKTGDKLSAHGLDLRRLEYSELAKAEGALTCCSLLIER